MRCFVVLGVCLLILFTCTTVEAVFGAEKTFKMDKFVGKCPEYKSLPITITQARIVPNDDGQLIMNMTMVVQELINGPLKFELKIERCNTKRCEQLHAIRTKRYCEMVVSETDNTFRQIFQAVKPKWQCPIQKGTYKAVNASFDISGLMMMATNKSVWKIRVEVSDTSGKPVKCFMGVGHVEY